MQKSNKIDWNLEPIASIIRAGNQLPFPQIPENIKIRPSFDTNDLKLIRKAFECLSKNSDDLNDGQEARQLFSRMLRKVNKLQN
jgi:hypothetical protein